MECQSRWNLSSTALGVASHLALTRTAEPPLDLRSAHCFTSAIVMFSLCRPILPLQLFFSDHVQPIVLLTTGNYSAKLITHLDCVINNPWLIFMSCGGLVLPHFTSKYLRSLKESSRHNEKEHDVYSLMLDFSGRHSHFLSD